MARFPFVEPPDTRSVAGRHAAARRDRRDHDRARRADVPADGRRRRDEPRPRSVTGSPSSGRQLAQLPIDPRLGRMMVEASRQRLPARGRSSIVAALSMQDPRERPSDQQELADQKHRRFADPASDFAGILNLWRYVKEQQKELSSSAFRRMCRSEFLNYLRIREWQDLDASCARSPSSSASRLNKQPAAAEAIHRSLLAGLLSHIGMKDEEKRDYLGARGTRFAIFPGSALFKKQPPFVMAAELVETARLWGRVNASIEPEWAEEVGAHLVKRTLQRAALGEEARRGDGAREGDPVRRTDRRRPSARSTTAGSTRRRRASSSSGTRWCKGSGTTHHRFFAANQRTARGGRGARASRPAARHRRRRRDDLRLLRRSRAGRRRLDGAFRLVVEEAAAHPTRTC